MGETSTPKLSDRVLDLFTDVVFTALGTIILFYIVFAPERKGEKYEENTLVDLAAYRRLHRRPRPRGRG